MKGGGASHEGAFTTMARGWDAQAGGKMPRNGGRVFTDTTDRAASGRGERRGGATLGNSGGAFRSNAQRTAPGRDAPVRSAAS